MELSHQVCSLPLAKRLKELGIKQDSMWYWIGVTEYDPPEEPFGNPTAKKVYRLAMRLSSEPNHWIRTTDGKHEAIIEYSWPDTSSRDVHDEIYSAFSVAELGRMLPADFTAEKQEDGWNGGYCSTIGRESDTEANLRADILAALIERGIVDVESLVDPEIQFMLGEKR